MEQCKYIDSKCLLYFQNKNFEFQISKDVKTENKVVDKVSYTYVSCSINYVNLICIVFIIGIGMFMMGYFYRARIQRGRIIDFKYDKFNSNDNKQQFQTNL